MSDAVLMGIIAFFVSAVTFGLSSIYYASRVDDLRHEFQQRLAQANAEVVTMRDMVRRTEIQARVMGAVPVSRLIGGDVAHPDSPFPYGSSDFDGVRRER